MARIIGVVGSVYERGAIVSLEDFAECEKWKPIDEEDLAEECEKWGTKQEIVLTIIEDNSKASIVLEPGEVDKLIEYLRQAKENSSL